EVREAGTTLPGYGWVFPMGNGRINVGTGLLSTYPDWRRVNTAHLLAAFIRSLPESWSLPDPAELQREGSVKGWRLPMAFAVWPPCRPGVLVAGDAAGVVNPFNGEGISEAVESGVVGAEVIMQALEGSGPSDLSAYEDRLQDLWGPYYRLGRVFARLIGRPRMMRLAIDAGMHVPPVMSFAFKILSNVYMQQGGTAGDRTVRGMVRLASLIRLG
ncbi:MAG TPA: hypothetical protein VNE62_02135, partial [Actinomycetota bacterium]|nr:hypothetical protein [Actinomycetota bacterium]